MICVIFAEWSLAKQKFGGYRLSMEDLLEQNLGVHSTSVLLGSTREFAAICVDDHICVI
jgi:hypothetical protein